MPQADLILHSGRVWDGSHLPGVEAVAIAGGRIEATGGSAEILALGSEQTRRIDVGGRRIMPGLIDSHIHMVRGGLRWNHDVRWNGLNSLDTGLGLLASTAAKKERGEWTAVLGGWNPHQFEESRPPSRGQLDEAVPESPVFVQRNYIEAFLNTVALETLGWAGVDVPDWVEIDPESGSPTGRVVGVPALQVLGQ
ncbi:MAG: amidohydrolase family protein, partial [Acidimicrobiia bacterium]